MVLDTDGFGCLHFLSYIRERTDVITNIYDRKFRLVNRFIEMDLIIFYEILYVLFDSMTDFTGQLITIETYIFRYYRVHLLKVIYNDKMKKFIMIK